MEIADKLNDELSQQSFSSFEKVIYNKELEKYKIIAKGYSEIENCISVLSDMQSNKSYIYHGSFSTVLGLKNIPGEGDRINSIWEKEILNLIFPEDLYNKYLQELRFFHFIKHLPKKKRSDYYLINKLRMRNKNGNFIPVVHRIFYVSSPVDNSLWLALCLYYPLISDIPHNSVLVNSATGDITEMGKRKCPKILSEREMQILKLIDKGLMSKNIAESLSISINTVSRHRQEILGKLKVKNSIEACRVAKDLGIIS